MLRSKKDAIYGVIDQALISLSNFLLGFFLIKLTTKESYGLYGVGFSLILLFVGFSNALITTQMAVHAPDKDDQGRYCWTMLYALVFLFLMLLLAFGGLQVVHLKFEQANENVIYYSTVAVVIFLAVIHEFMRRYFYVSLSPLNVIKIDLIGIAGVFSGLGLLVLFLSNFTHIEAISVYGVSSGLAGLAGILISENFKQRVSLLEVKKSFKEAWAQGRWALGGVIVTWLQSQSYVALLTMLATSTEIAEANAAKLFLSPVSVVSTSLAQVFFPKMAFLRRQEGKESVMELSNKVLLFVLSVIFVISSVVLLAKNFVIANYLPSGYSNIGSLVLAWSGVFAAQALRVNASQLLQVYKRFRVITTYGFFTAIATVLLAWVLIIINGAIGSIQAIILGELLLALFLRRAFRVYESN